MKCPNCGCDRHRVLPRPERFAEYDLRQAICQQCGLRIEIRSVISGVFLFNPVREEEERMTPDAFNRIQGRDILRGRASHPAYHRLDHD